MSAKSQVMDAFPLTFNDNVDSPAKVVEDGPSVKLQARQNLDRAFLLQLAAI